MMSTVSEILGEQGKGPRGRCSVCFEERTVQVQVRISLVDANGKGIQGQSRSRSASFCDVHGAEAFTAARKAVKR